MPGIGGLRLSELKPCPSCGGTAILRAAEYLGGYYVCCSNCRMVLGDDLKGDATGCFEAFDTAQKAINAWNNLGINNQEEK